jgi:hypothetical protein
LQGWEARLSGVIEEFRHRPYAIGETDCFRLTCRVVEALTGADRWPEFVGYTTERESLLVMARYGSTFEEAFDWFFGAPSVSVRLARRGDICHGPGASGEKPLAVCLGAEVAGLGVGGLTRVPLLSCHRAWRVG